MIPLELSHALALYSSVIAVLIAGIWVYTEFYVKRPQRVLGKQFLWRCTFCGFTYLDEGAEKLSQCPRCESFNDVTENPHIRTKVMEPEVETAPDHGTSKRKRHHQRRRGPRRRR